MLIPPSSLCACMRACVCVCACMVSVPGFVSFLSVCLCVCLSVSLGFPGAAWSLASAALGPEGLG